MSDYPHVRAAFINAIAEEGTKAEAVEWLQKQWNENCALREQIVKLTEALEPFAKCSEDTDDTWSKLGNNERFFRGLTLGDLRRARAALSSTKAEKK